MNEPKGHSCEFKDGFDEGFSSCHDALMRVIIKNHPANAGEIVYNHSVTCKKCLSQIKAILEQGQKKIRLNRKRLAEALNRNFESSYERDYKLNDRMQYYLSKADALNAKLEGLLEVCDA